MSVMSLFFGSDWHMLGVDRNSKESTHLEQISVKLPFLDVFFFKLHKWLSKIKQLVQSFFLVVVLEQKRKFINQFETVRNEKQAEVSHIPALYKRCKALPDGCRKLLQCVQPQLPSNFVPLFQTLKVRRSQNTEGFLMLIFCQRIPQTLCVWSF